MPTRRDHEQQRSRNDDATDGERESAFQESHAQAGNISSETSKNSLLILLAHFVLHILCGSYKRGT
jgi:hypothetical protein